MDDSSATNFGPYEDHVVGQLEASSQAFTARGLPLQLIGYTGAAPLADQQAVESVKADLIARDAVVPQFDGSSSSSLALHTVEERQHAFVSGADSQDVVANLQQIVFPTLAVGQRTMDVTWQSNGEQFQTRLIYDENGIVYDNLLSNLVFVEGGEVEAQQPPAAGKGEVGAQANQSFSTRFLNYTISWVWGGTRGKIELDHYVITCNNWVSFCDDGGAANAWMSLGSAGGQTRRNALIYPRISKRAWGYGWATPTASFSITWNSGSLTFSASTSGVGSAGKGSGVHTIY
ncbi:MAG: hypothetical protein R3B48_12820 [Kofleriaceae bacterium]